MKRIAHFFAALLVLMMGASAIAANKPKLAMEEFMVPSGAPGINLYVRNKHPQGVTKFAADKILLYVHGSTYPASTAFDLQLNQAGKLSDTTLLAGSDYDQEEENKIMVKETATRIEAQKKQQDEQKRAAEARERQARETAALTAQAARERQAREAEALAAQTAREAQERARQQREADARARAIGDYIARIRTKIKNNVNMPAEIPGNPTAVYEVVQLPTGEIIDIALRKSSGVRAYDEAVERAIRKSSPLPRPEQADLWQRTLTLEFRPRDQ